MSINDYKFDVISVMNSIGEASNTNLILLLQDGIAIGRLPLETDLEDDNSLIKLFNKCFKEFRESEVQEYPQAISLVDVKYTSSGATVNLPHMVFFIDQIVGVSIGLESPKNVL